MKKSTISVILISVAVLSGTYLFVQYTKQRSIEKQEQINLKAKIDQENKTYVAKRKSDCYNISKTEEKYSNFRNGYYDEASDNCVIEYNAKNGEYGWSVNY